MFPCVIVISHCYFLICASLTQLLLFGNRMTTFHRFEYYLILAPYPVRDIGKHLTFLTLSFFD